MSTGHDPLLEVLALLATVGCGLNGGFFFAFSVVVMRALGKRPAPEAIAAMQEINVVVLNRWFFGAFFGTAVLCLAAIVVAAIRWGDHAAPWLLGGGLMYLAGTIWVTMQFNVPRNEALKRVSPSDADGARLWNDYLVTWTAWNHVRAAAAVLAAACFGMALHV
jgi:uncharacterized membrane protein